MASTVQLHKVKKNVTKEEAQWLTASTVTQGRCFAADLCSEVGTRGTTFLTITHLKQSDIQESGTLQTEFQRTLAPDLLLCWQSGPTVAETVRALGTLCYKCLTSDSTLPGH